MPEIIYLSVPDITLLSALVLMVAAGAFLLATAREAR
jgi:hypothetical protein